MFSVNTKSDLDQKTFKISVCEVENFSVRAVKELEQSCSNYLENIIKEAKNIEKRERNVKDAEITASHVKDATHNYVHRQKKRVWLIILMVILDVLLLFDGLLFDIEKLKSDTVFLILYIFMIVLSILLIVIKYMKGE